MQAEGKVFRSLSSGTPASALLLRGVSGRWEGRCGHNEPMFISKAVASGAVVKFLPFHTFFQHCHERNYAERVHH